MTAPLPIRSRILANVVSTLAGITVANGFHTESGGRAHRGIREYGKVQCPNFDVDVHEPEAYEEQGNGSLEKTLHVECIGNLKPPTTGDEASLEAERMLADMEKALRTDRTRGGLAQNTALKRSYINDAEPGLPFVEVHLFLEVLYRVPNVDPFTAT